MRLHICNVDAAERDVITKSTAAAGDSDAGSGIYDVGAEQVNDKQ